MPKQSGIFFIIGSLGNVNFYQANGQYLVRTKYTIPLDKLRNNSNYAATRAQITDFAQVARTGKLIRNSLRLAFGMKNEFNMMNRLNEVLYKILKTDTVNRKGERKIINGNFNLLKGFRFNKTIYLREVYKTSDTVLVVENKATGKTVSLVFTSQSPVVSRQ